MGAGKILIHFRGLKPEEQAWYYNQRGAQVPVYSGDWARLDPAQHPELRYLLESGVAIVSPAPSSDVEVLDDSPDPNWARKRAKKHRADPRKKVQIAQRSGLPDVHQLTPEKIEQARHLFLPRQPEDPLTDAYVDARVVNRHRVPLAAKVPSPYEHNFIVLYRLAWLLCRAHRLDWAAQRKETQARRSRWVEEYHYEWGTDRSALRKKAEQRFQLPVKPRMSVGTVLGNWGVLRGSSPPSPSTLHRYRQRLGLTRIDVDRLILAAIDGNRPVLVIGRIGPGFGSVAIGPYVPEGQSSRLTQAEVEGVAWMVLPHPGSPDPPQLRFLAKTSSSLPSITYE